jgi:hypothetical protein
MFPNGIFAVPLALEPSPEIALPLPSLVLAPLTPLGRASPMKNRRVNHICYLPLSGSLILLPLCLVHKLSLDLALLVLPQSRSDIVVQINTR